jgi:NAD(P)-dependent dehydrogenase (short-subunit alcohol dehydrogenase family)
MNKVWLVTGSASGLGRNIAEAPSRGSEGLPDVVLTCGRTFARGYRLQQPTAQRHRGLTADGLAIRADGSSQLSGIGKIGPWPRSADNGPEAARWPIYPVPPVAGVGFAAA